MKESTEFDVIIVGGSYAGLSAALALGRSLRKVLIIDSELPCNRQTPHSHNFLTQDGKTPGEIAQIAKEQVEKYETVTFLNGRAVDGVKTEQGFSITTEANTSLTAKKLIFATGVKDTMPDIKGFSECWGKTIIHCPYCHGYEFKHKTTGIYANSQKAFHLAGLVTNLTDKLTLIIQENTDFNEQQMEQLQKHTIDIIDMEIAEIEQEEGNLKKVIFTDGTHKAFDALYAGIPFTQHSDIPLALGCAITDQGYIKVNEFQETTVEGVFACGDNSSMMRSVANAVFTGNMSGAVVNGMLSTEEF